jgi:hypothetical protein
LYLKFEYNYELPNQSKMTSIKITNKLTIELPSFFENLPKDIQNLAFEFNIDHRSQMKIVLDQLVYFIHCVNCNGLIDPSILNKVNCCSSICMYQLRDDPYYINM